MINLSVAIALAAVSAPPRQVVTTPVKNPDRIYQLSELKTATITVGAKKLKVWLMDTPTKRQEGMMFLRESDVSMSQGMLFVFPQAQPLSFWMRNTLMPLDIAYIAPNRKILNTMPMKALDESGHPSKGPAMYALEMKRGAFAKYKIKAGMTVAIPKSVRASN